MKKIFHFLSFVFVFGAVHFGLAQYCTPSSTNCAAPVIQVTINGVNGNSITNSSACGAGGYEDFTAQSADLTIGGSHQASLTVDPGTSLTTSYYIFVDWNGDGDFVDAGEAVTNGNAGAATSNVFTLNPPATANAGPVRIRFRTNTALTNNNPPCGNYGSGEAEDYTLNLVTSSPVPPNCAINTAPADQATGICLEDELSWEPDGLGGTPSGYKVYFGTATGPALVSTQTATTYDPGTLMPNTTYYWSVVPYNGSGDATGCAEYTFTTSDLSASITPNPAVTCVNTVLSLTGTSTGGATGAQTHSWSGTGASQLSSTNTAATDFSASTDGNYALTYTVEDADGCTASENISVQVDPATVVDVSIALTNGTNPACAGDPLEFTATPTNGGSSPTYSWRVNGTPAATGAVFTSSSLNNGDVVDVLMASSEACPDDPNKQSNSITVTITGSVAPDVTIAVTDGNNPTCPGAYLEYTATPINGGTSPTYSWRVNGTASATGNVFDATALNDQDVVDVIMTSSSGCVSTPTATSLPETIVHTAAVTPTIAISVDNSPYCAGEALTFSASTTGEGNTPAYEWFVNGVSVATTANFNAGVLTDGDLVTCELTSSEVCTTASTAQSNVETVAYTAPEDPSANIIVQTGNNPGCPNELLEFRADPVFGGSNPTYEWFVNGVSSGTGNIFGSSSFVDQDQVTVTVTSDYFCLNQPTGTSDPTTVSIVASIVPEVTIHTVQGGEDICSGTEVVFEPTPTNGGATPSYEWFVNGTSVSTDEFFVTSNLNDQDQVTCQLTSSNGCANPSTVVSTPIVITVTQTPLMPSISVSGDVLTSSATTGNQWMLDGADIPGATNQTHTAVIGGIYSVRVINGDCISENAEPLDLTNLSVSSLETDLNWNSYPNPTSGILYLEFGKAIDAVLIVMDALGKVVLNQSVTGSKATILMHDLDKGVYFVKVQTGPIEKTFRVVKQ